MIMIMMRYLTLCHILFMRELLFVGAAKRTLQHQIQHHNTSPNTVSSKSDAWKLGARYWPSGKDHNHNQKHNHNSSLLLQQLLSRDSFDFQKLLNLKGGAMTTTTSVSRSRSNQRNVNANANANANANTRNKAATTNDDNQIFQNRRRREQVIGYGIAIIAAAYLIYEQRGTIARLLPTNEEIRDKTLNLLERINTRPTIGILYYTLGLSLCEALGLTTIPIETAAGMAFSFKRAIVASTAGRMLGAALSFRLGRSVLKEWVKSKMEGNEIFRLIESTGAQNPFRTVILLKYSCFPGFVKNYGSSLLDPISVWHLVLATLIHGAPFTCLWTYLGIDTKMRMENLDLPPDRLLHSLLLSTGVFGVVVSPLAMGWWIRDLQQHRNQQQDKKITRKVALSK